MQIGLKLIQSINHAKLTICIRFQFFETFSSLFTGSSSLSVFPRGVLYQTQLHTDPTMGLLSISREKEYANNTTTLDGTARRFRGCVIVGI